MEEMTYQVLVQTDDSGRITAINSSAFLHDMAGWTKIDEGHGDKYHHAQGNYLPGLLMDDRGVCRYKLVDGEVVERTQAEMGADYTPPTTDPAPDGSMASLAAEVAALRESNAQLQEALDLLLSWEVGSDV